MSQWLEDIKEIPLTIGLISLHLLLFLLMWASNPAGVDTGAGFSFSPETLLAWGGQQNLLIWRGEYHRLLFSGFLHGSLLHLILNNLALYSLGRLLERLSGRLAFCILYLLSLLAGTFASLIWLPPTAVSVGASGAIMGLAGCLSLFLLLDRQHRFLQASTRARNFFLLLVALNLLLGEILPMINNVAHLGGLLMGCLLALFFWSRIPGEKLSRHTGNSIFFLAFASLLAVLLWGLLYPSSSHETLTKANTALSQGKLAEAESYFQQATHQAETSLTLRSLGDLLSQTEQWTKAEPIFRRLVQREPQEFEYWVQWITALAWLKKTKQAEDAFQQARKRFQAHPYQEYIDTVLLIAVQREREALILLHKLLERLPDNPILNNTLAWLLLTSADLSYRNPSLALRHATLAVEQTKGRYGAFLDTLATALFQLNKPKEALQTLEKAMRCPDAPRHHPHFLRQKAKFQAALATSRPISPVLRSLQKGRPLPSSSPSTLPVFPAPSRR